MDQSFELDIDARLRGGVEAITQLERTEKGFTDAKSALSGYEKELLGLEKALEKNRAAAEAMKEKFTDAVNAGDSKGIAKYADAYKQLEKEETKLRKSHEATHDALTKQQKVVQDSADKAGLLKKANADAEKGLGGFITKQTEGFSATEAATAAMAAEYAAALALVAGLAAATAALVKYTLAQSNAHRNTVQTLRAQTQSEDDAKRLGAAYFAIAKQTGASDEQLNAWNKTLTEGRRTMGLARFSGDQLEKALKAAATASLALDDPSAGQALIDQMNAGIYTADQLADRVEKQFGDVARQKMLGLDQQIGTLKANLAELFGEEDIKSFLTGLSRIVALFDTSTESGKALRSLLHAFFKPFGDSADDAFVLVERGFLYLELGLLKLGIYVKKHTEEFRKGWDIAKVALKGVAVILATVATGVLLFLTPMIVTTAAVIAGFTALALAIGYVGDHVGDIAKWFEGAWDSVKVWSDKLIHIGSDIIAGISDDISKGEEKVKAAIVGVMKGAVQAAKDAIGMHSPPKAYVDIAQAITTTTADTIDQGAGDVASAVDRMMTPPTAASTGGGGGGTSLSGNQFVYHGVKDAQHAKELTLASLTELLEDWGSSTGAEAVT